MQSRFAPSRLARWERTLEARATVLLVAAGIVLALLGFARLYTVTTDLKATQQQLAVAQATACRLRREGRANTNLHERLPLRAAFKYLGETVTKAAQNQTDPAKRAATLFGRRFLTYAAQIEPLTNPKC